MESSIKALALLADKRTLKHREDQIGPSSPIIRWEFTLNGARVQCLTTDDLIGPFAFEVATIGDLAQIAGKTVEGEE